MNTRPLRPLAASRRTSIAAVFRARRIKVGSGQNAKFNRSRSRAV